jgi:hypothetical protein
MSKQFRKREIVSYKWNSELDSKKYNDELQSECINKQLIKVMDNLQHNSINETVNNLTKILQQTANNSIKKIKKHKRKSYKKWFNSDCEKAKKAVKKLANKLQKNPYNNHVRQNFYIHKKIYKKTLKKCKKIYKQQCIERFEQMISSNPKEYWKAFQNLKKEEIKLKSDEKYIPLKKWVVHFEKVYDKFEDDPELRQLLLKEEAQPHFFELDSRINEKEVSDAIKKLKAKKTAGHDSIIGEMIKAGQTTLTPFLVKIFNHIFMSKEYPEEWNKGIITPIHKKGSKYNPNNYRGITINNAIAKVYSMILRNRLENFIKKHKIIQDTQIGFKKNSQTVDHVMVLQALSEKYIDKGKLHVCFIDFKKAYDSVWRQALLYKLLKQNIRGLLYYQIKALYDKVLVCVKQNDQLSKFFTSNRGVKQGEVLSPILFNLFINDINDCFDETCDPVILNNRKISCLQYTDDLVLISESKYGMEKCLRELDKYCTRWKLEINTDKSKAMVINKRGTKPKDFLKIGNSQLEYVNSYVYLGIEISSNGKFTQCKQGLTTKGKKAMNKLKSLIVGTNIKKSLALKMFDQLVFPILSYGCEVWGFEDLGKVFTSKNPLTIEETYNKLAQEKLNIHFCKYILGVSSKSTNLTVMAELGRYPLAIKIITQMLKYYAKILNSDKHTLLSDALEEMKVVTNKGKITWLRTIRNIVETIGLDMDFITQHIVMKNKVVKYIRNILEDRFQTHWKNIMNKQEEMYSKLKKNFEYEKYLDQLKYNNKQQQTLTKLRIGNHKIQTETNRYKKSYVQKKERICKMCNTEVEDIFHFMFTCQKLQGLRKDILGKNVIIGKNKITLLKVYLFDFKNIQSITVATYLCKANDMRDSLLTEIT